MNVDVDSYPESRVRNSQPHGIGRVAALDGLCAWNNLGRNVVFADEDFRPRAVFDESVFTEDEPSQYDLDVHAILEIRRHDLVLTLNHYGMLRAFDPITLKELWNNQIDVHANEEQKNYWFAKFVPPTIAMGRVYLATASGKVLVYGIVGRNH